jgi:hypothetical protein
MIPRSRRVFVFLHQTRPKKLQAELADSDSHCHPCLTPCRTNIHLLIMSTIFATIFSNVNAIELTTDSSAPSASEQKPRYPKRKRADVTYFESESDNTEDSTDSETECYPVKKVFCIACKDQQIILTRTASKKKSRQTTSEEQSLPFPLIAGRVAQPDIRRMLKRQQ